MGIFDNIRDAFLGWLLSDKLDLFDRKLSVIIKELEDMGVREDAADLRFNELVGLVRDAYQAQVVEIATLRAALDDADATAQQRVDAALEADSDFDAQKKEEGNAALEELLSRPEPTPADPSV